MEPVQHLYHRPCTHCDKPVPTTIPRGPIFCSTQCYRTNAKKYIRPKDVVFRYEKQCAQCGSGFGTNNSNQKLCGSRNCKLSASREYQRAKGHLYRKSQAYLARGKRLIESVRSLGSELCRLSQEEYDAIQNGFEREMGLEFQVGAMFEEVKNLRGTVHWENRILHHIGEVGVGPRAAINQRRKYA